MGSDLWGRVSGISDRLTIEHEGIREEELIQELGPEEMGLKLRWEMSLVE